MQEWTSFVEREKRLRSSLQSRAERAISDVCGLRDWATNQVASVRHEIENEVDLLLNALRDKSSALEDAHLRLTTRLHWGANLLEAKRCAVLGRRILAIWRAHVAQRRYYRHVVAKLQERTSLRAGTRSLSGWLQVCEVKRIRRAKLRAAVRRMALLKMYHVFSTWRSDVENKARAAAAEEEVVSMLRSRFLSNRMRWVLDGWRSRTHRASEAMRLLRAAALRSSHRRMFDAFHAWRHRTEASRLETEKLSSRTTMSFRNKIMSSLFNAWRLSVEDSLGSRLQLRHAERVLARQRGVRALVAWRMCVVEGQKERYQWIRSVEINQRNVLKESVSVWHEFACRQRRNRETLVSFVHSRADRRTRLVFQFWRAYQQHQRYALELTEYTENQGALALMSASFESWRTSSRASRTLRRRASMIHQKRRVSYLKEVFQAWKQHATLKVFQRSLTDAFKANVALHRMRLSMHVLREHASQAVHDRRLTMKAVAWYSGRLQARALWALEEAVSRRRTFLDRLSCVADQRDLTLLRGHWEMWLQSVGETKATQLAMRRFQCRRDWYRIKLSFASWKSETKLSLNLNQKMVACVERVNSSRKVWVLDVWWHLTSEAVQERLKENHLRRRLDRMRISSALSRWMHHVHRISTIESFVENRSSIGARESLHNAFITWSDIVERRRAQRDFEAKLSKRRRQDLLVSALSTWKDVTSRTRDQRILLKKCIARIASIRLGWCMSIWRTSTEDAMGERLRLGSIGLTLALRHEEIIARRVFTTWRGRTTEIKASVLAFETKNSVQQAVMLRSVFCCWRYNARRALMLEQRAVQSLVERRASRLQWLAFKSWRLEATITARDELVVLHRSERLMLRAGRSAFEAWRSEVKARRVRKAALMRFLHRVSLSRSASAFNAWRDLAAQRAAAQEELRSCLIRKRIAFRHFRQWYWDSFDSDLRATLRAMFDTEGDIEDAMLSDGELASLAIPSWNEDGQTTRSQGRTGKELVPYSETDQAMTALQARIHEALAEAKHSPMPHVPAKERTTIKKANIMDRPASLFAPLESLYSHPGELKRSASLSDDDDHDSDLGYPGIGVDNEPWLRESKNNHGSILSSSFLHVVPPLSPVLEGNEDVLIDVNESACATESPPCYGSLDARKYCTKESLRQPDFAGSEGSLHPEALTVDGIASLGPAETASIHADLLLDQTLAFPPQTGYSTSAHGIKSTQGALNAEKRSLSVAGKQLKSAKALQKGAMSESGSQARGLREPVTGLSAHGDDESIWEKENNAENTHRRRNQYAQYSNGLWEREGHFRMLDEKSNIHTPGPFHDAMSSRPIKSVGKYNIHYVP